MEGNGIGRNLGFSKLDGKQWNRKEPGNFKNRWKKMKLEGTWKCQNKMERNVIERNLKITKIDETKWNWKEPGNLRNSWKEIELEGA